MMQVIKQTRDEKIAMYMKLKKREIAEMLVNANEGLDVLQKPQRRRQTWWCDDPYRNECG